MPGEPRPLPHIEIPEWILELMGLGGGEDEPEPVEPVTPPEPAPAPETPPPPPPPPLAGQEEVFGLPVDPVAIAHAETVRRILNATESFQPGRKDAGSASSITVLTHPDGTITIGVSGHKLGTVAAVKALKDHPDLPKKTRIGPPEVVLDRGLNETPCSEVRAILGAQRDEDGNRPPAPTGMATIPRDPNGKTARKFGDPEHPGTLCPCSTCAERGPALRPMIGVPPANAPGG